MAAAGESSTVPQWKRELIQRRRQQSKVLASNGASVKLCSVMGGSSVATEGAAAEHPDCNGGVAGCASSLASHAAHAAPSRGGATVATGPTSPVARAMRLDADLSHVSDAEDVADSVEASAFEADDYARADRGEKEPGGKMKQPQQQVQQVQQVQVQVQQLVGDDETRASNEEDPARAKQRAARLGSDEERSKERITIDETEQKPHQQQQAPRNAGSNEDEEEKHGRKAKSSEISMIAKEVSRAKQKTGREDGGEESDSSEELQYGPGIVNRLKSKYLNLTLRETSKSRATVQRFRRAASLEDLLDCDEEPEKSARKYAKREPGSGAGAGAKGDRYRNAGRGNESMKRARSVETLMRYNADEPSGNGPRQDPVNDHIVLIDRTSVKIESRLGELDRPKALNKPKRLRPVVAETERPPPDLVKTTMRIFEGSARKLKPKGEVAAKVATFKTINDTYKAQTLKKIVPKPPVQPKPFVNGSTRPQGSPKRIVLPQKPTAELIENRDGREEYHIDGVITEPIVQSVSSVVSKFQQIEKSHSPSPSPEPAFRLRFSPAPSPEPSVNRPKVGLEIGVRSPPVTPILSPRISSPTSPVREPKQCSPRILSPASPVKEAKPGAGQPRVDAGKFVRSQLEKDAVKTAQGVDGGSRSSVVNAVEPEQRTDADNGEEERVAVEEEEGAEEVEEVDGPKTISKSALENIARAGTTVQFSFGDKPVIGKTYLPGFRQNGQKRPEVARDEVVLVSSDRETGRVARTTPEENRVAPVESKGVTVADGKPIGAICSLGLVKPGEPKVARCPKEPASPPQKQIGIIRPLVSTKPQHAQQSLSNRELEKNLINRVKSIEQQPTKVVVSLKSADEIQPAKKSSSGLWDSKSWSQQNNTMVFNFSNRKDVPDYIENDGMFVRRKREKPKVGEGGIIVLDATLDASTTDDSEWEISGGPPSPCDVSFLNDNVLINGRSNLSRTPRNHKHRIQFDDTATRTFEYPSEASMLEVEGSNVDGETSASGEQSPPVSNKTSSATSMPSLLGGGGLASYTPSKVDLASEGFELGVTRAAPTTPSVATPSSAEQPADSEVDYLKPAQDAGAWGSETTGDLLY